MKRIKIIKSKKFINILSNITMDISLKMIKNEKDIRNISNLKKIIETKQLSIYDIKILNELIDQRIEQYRKLKTFPYSHTYKLRNIEFSYIKKYIDNVKI